jgi:hypothetical protein
MIMQEYSPDPFLFLPVGFKRFEVIHLAGPSKAAIAYK